MNDHIRMFGWVLFGIGCLLTMAGLVALVEFVHIQVDAVGINLDTTTERIAWIVSWLVAAVSGGLLLALTHRDSR